MTRILVDPESLSDAERCLRRESEQLYQVVGGLERALTSLDWESEAGQLLSRESGRILSQSRELVQALLRLADQVRHSREQVLAADWHGYTKLERLALSQPEWARIGLYVGWRLLDINAKLLLPFAAIPSLPPVRPKVADTSIIGRLDSFVEMVTRPHTLIALGGAMLLDRIAPAQGKRAFFERGGSWAGVQLGAVERNKDGSVKFSLASGYLGPESHRGSATVGTAQASFNAAGKVAVSAAVAEIGTYQHVLRMGPANQPTVTGDLDRRLRLLGGSVLIDDEWQSDNSVGVSADAYALQLDVAAVVRIFDIESRVGFKGCALCIGTPPVQLGAQGELGGGLGKLGAAVYWDVGEAVTFLQNRKVSQGTGRPS